MKQEKTSQASSFVEIIKEYFELRLELVQLNFTEKLSLLIGKFVLILFMAFFGLSLFLLLLVLVYNLLLSWLGIPWLVALIEIGIIGLFMLVAWIFKNKLIIEPVASMIVRTINEKEMDYEAGKDTE